MLMTLACAATMAVSLNACAAGAPGSEDNKDVTIALLVGLSGASAATGQTVEKSVELAIDRAKEQAGDVNYSVRVYDTKATPEEASKLAQRAITVDKVKFVIASGGSAEALAIKEVVERNKVPYINASASADPLTQDAKYTFRIAPTLTDTAEGVTKIAADLGLKSVGILYDNGAVGAAFKDLYGSGAKKNGLSSNAVQYTAGASDVTGAVRSISQGSPGAVLIGGSLNADYGLIAKTMVEQGLTVPVMGTSGVASADALSVGGSAYPKLDGAYTVQSTVVDKPAYVAFIDAYKKKYGSADGLNDFAAQVFDATNFAIASLKAAKSTDGTEVVSALTGLSPVDGASGATPISFQTSHNGFSGKYLLAYKLVQGKLVAANLAK